MIENTLEKNLEKMREIEMLKDNWNDNNASKFSSNLIEKCKKILNQLKIQPEIFPTANDSIQFEYQNNTTYLEFEIFEEKIEVYIEVNEKQIKNCIVENIYEMNQMINQMKEG